MRHNEKNNKFLSILFAVILVTMGTSILTNGNAFAQANLNTGKEDACGPDGPTNQSSVGGKPSGGPINSSLSSWVLLR